jgi:ribonucleoside-diphosphate reductase alpha chain
VNPDGEWLVEEVIQRDAEPEVALCSLAAIIPSFIESEEQYADVAYYCLKMIDVCIHLSDFPIPHIAYTARQRLSAGVGLTGVAHYMAKRRKRYTTIDGKQELHRLAERHAYHLIRASLRLGQELGNAPWIHRTKWPEGWLPLDTYCKKVDEIADFELQYDWETLKQKIIDNGGIRNSTLIAHMPTESSSKASGVPNGLYPIRDFALGKSDNGMLIDWAPTDGDRLKRYYEIAWDIPMTDQIDLYAVTQKWTDQGISGDNWIRLEGDSTVWTEDLMNASIEKARKGIKGRYYFNSKTSKTIVNEATGEETVVVITTEHNTADKCVSGGCDV